MTDQEFIKVMTDIILPNCVSIMDTKGKNYSGGQDVFRNFENIAKDLDLDIMKVWWVYLKKHLDAIRSVVRGEHIDDGEKIAGRFYDAINYLFLGIGLIQKYKPEYSDKELVEKIKSIVGEM